MKRKDDGRLGLWTLLEPVEGFDDITVIYEELAEYDQPHGENLATTMNTRHARRFWLKCINLFVRVGKAYFAMNALYAVIFGEF